MINKTLPIKALSIRDFVFETKGLSKEELITKADLLKLVLKELPTGKDKTYYPIGCEVEALIDFIHKIVWRLTQNKFPGGFDESYKSQYLEVIRRYFPNEK